MRSETNSKKRCWRRSSRSKRWPRKARAAAKTAVVMTDAVTAIGRMTAAVMVAVAPTAAVTTIAVPTTAAMTKFVEMTASARLDREGRRGAGMDTLTRSAP